jgi:integrase/recombinase XerD
MIYANIESYHPVFPGKIQKNLTENTVHRGDQCSYHRIHALTTGIQRLSEAELPEPYHAQRYLQHKYRCNLRASTMRGTISFLIIFLSFLSHHGTASVHMLSREDLEAFIEHLQDQGLQANTIASRVKQVKAFVRFLIEEGVVAPQVLSKRLTIKVPDSLPRAIPPEDMRRVIDVIEDIRDRALILVLLRTGMRIGELLATTMGEVLCKERKILIYEAQKNRVGRVVYLSDDAVGALEAWLTKRDPTKEYLFYARGSTTMCYTTARTMFQRYLMKAGLAHTGYTLHSLRHTFATELLNAGMHIECLQPLLGHRSLVMTRRYARLSDTTREQEYFKAMEIIERGEKHVHYQLDSELQAILEEAQLLPPHR